MACWVHSFVMRAPFNRCESDGRMAGKDGTIGYIGVEEQSFRRANNFLIFPLFNFAIFPFFLTFNLHCESCDGDLH